PVAVAPLGVRANTSPPSRPFSRLICAVKAGWLRLKLSALERLPISLMATSLPILRQLDPDQASRNRPKHTSWSPRARQIKTIGSRDGCIVPNVTGGSHRADI